MNKIDVVTSDQWLDLITKKNHQAQQSYLAMYSSWINAVTTDPTLMIVPIDDHLVHRGDGVFEAIKMIDDKIYLLDAHINRLFHSAEKIGLVPRWSKEEIANLIAQVVRVTKVPQAIIRVFLSRGPGTFSTNPYDSVGSQLYIVVTTLAKIPSEKHKAGVLVGKSQVQVKSDWMAQVKSCNYLPNVMMKKEAVDRRLDFTVSFDEKGYLAEGSTENIVVLTSDHVLVHPGLERILHGTTMRRLFDLVEMNKILPVQRGVPLTEGEIKKAKALYMVGTTLDVLRVKRFEEVEFSPNEFDEKLLSLIQQDQVSGPVSISVRSLLN